MKEEGSDIIFVLFYKTNPMQILQPCFLMKMCHSCASHTGVTHPAMRPSSDSLWRFTSDLVDWLKLIKYVSKYGRSLYVFQNSSQSDWCLCSLRSWQIRLEVRQKDTERFWCFWERLWMGSSQTDLRREAECKLARSGWSQATGLYSV